MLTDAQVGVLRRKRMEGKTQEAAAAAAGMSLRSARSGSARDCTPRSDVSRICGRCEKIRLPTCSREVVPLLAADRDGVEATTILAELNRRHPDRFESQLRTLQRRAHQWRALKGPEKEVTATDQFSKSLTVCGNLSL